MFKTVIYACLLFLLVLCGSTDAAAQEIIKLYDGEIPNVTAFAKTKTANIEERGMVRRVYTPTLEIYMSDREKANGAAVVICSGGGYSVIVYEGEGISAAKELAKNGVTAFVLKYRLPHDSVVKDKKIAPLQDAQQAIKFVREHAVKWNVDPRKIGVMGFSAGGHLASILATHFEDVLIGNKNGTSVRPDFQILVYPVLSMKDSLTHSDSKRQLLGNNPSNELVTSFSNELQVKENTPPAYLTHSADDATVDVDNTIAYFETLRKNKVPVELHVYPKGGHGFIFRHQGWMDPLFAWMKTNGWMK